MKFLMMLILSISSAAVADSNTNDPFFSKILTTEKFQAYLDARDGAVTCQDKSAVGTLFVPRPALISVANHGGRFGNRVSDYGNRTSRISYFSMELPDTVKCKDVLGLLPIKSIPVDATRELSAQLISQAGETTMELTETISFPIASGLVLKGRFRWIDFVVPDNTIDPSRDVLLQLLDRDPWQQTLSTTIRPSGDGIDCRKSAIEGKFEMAVKLELNGSTNTQEVSRIFESESDCLDKLSEMSAQISIDTLPDQNFMVDVTRKLQIEQRNGADAHGAPATIQVRAELLSLTFMGMQFNGSSAILMWTTST